MSDIDDLFDDDDKFDMKVPLRKRLPEGKSTKNKLHINA